MKTRTKLGLVLLALVSLVGSAEAIIGRPLTPFSYAGVARRTTRRAVMFGAAAPYGVPGPYPAYYW
jgi:hypothetical protein